MIVNTKNFVDINTTFYSDSKITTNDSYESINNSIDNILFTTKGEKVGDPLFGSNLKNLVFYPIDFITQKLIEFDILTNITNYEPRVSIVQIIVTPDEDENMYKIMIIYNLHRTPNMQNKYVTILKRL